MYNPNNQKGIKVQFTYHEGKYTYIKEVLIPDNELITLENEELWVNYLSKKLPQLIQAEAFNTPEYQEGLKILEERRKWEEERKKREEEWKEWQKICEYRKPLTDNLHYIPLGRNVDYEYYFHNYICGLLQWKPRTDDDFKYLMTRLKRWAVKTSAKHIEKQRPDVAYAIAKCFFINLPDFLNREDVAEKLEDSATKAKVNKLIRLFFEGLTQAVVGWNNEGKRQELITLLEEQMKAHDLIRKQEKKLRAMLPADALTGEPIAITYSLNAQEKREEAAKAEAIRMEKLRQEELAREQQALIKTNYRYDEMMEWGRKDHEGTKLAIMIRVHYKAELEKLLKAGKTLEGVMSFLQLLKSLCKYFVIDEHFCYFDDMYHPDYECNDIYELIRKHLKKHPDAKAEELMRKGFEEIRQMEAYWNYGIPSVCHSR